MARLCHRLLHVISRPAASELHENSNFDTRPSIPTSLQRKETRPHWRMLFVLLQRLRSNRQSNADCEIGGACQIRKDTTSKCLKSMPCNYPAKENETIANSGLGLPGASHRRRRPVTSRRWQSSLRTTQLKVWGLFQCSLLHSWAKRAAG